MSDQSVHTTEHDIEIAAPPEVVWDLIFHVTNWPQIFPPTVHVDHLDRNQHEERIRIWATANGELKHWTSRRELDAESLSIRFRQEVSAPPVAAMGGTWLLEPAGADRTRVRLLHDFTPVSEEQVSWIEQAITTNSEAELNALRVAAETRVSADGTVLEFEDVVHIEGAAKDVYDFLHRADRWSERLPHVVSVELSEPLPNVQRLTMDTRTPDGSTHTTESIRICFPGERIVYKQLRPPALLSVHTGEWTVRAEGDGAVVSSRHRVLVRPELIEEAVGAGSSMEDAHHFVRTALGRNSTTTMQHAKAYAEGRRAGEATGGEPEEVSADTYISIQQFYARQMRLLDEGDTDRWAESFAEDGVFQHESTRGEGRHEIARQAAQASARFAAAGLHRRHWLGMTSAELLPSGDVLARWYAVVFTTSGGEPGLRYSGSGEDVLTHNSRGWLIGRRIVRDDGR